MTNIQLGIGNIAIGDIKQPNRGNAELKKLVPVPRPNPYLGVRYIWGRGRPARSPSYAPPVMRFVKLRESVEESAGVARVGRI